MPERRPGPATILVGEPQCWGFEHSDFNAALLQTVALAFPEARVVFAGEAEHVRWVRSRMPDDASASGRVEWVEMEIPPRLEPWRWRNGLHGWRPARRWAKALRRLGRSRQAGLIVLASVTVGVLLAWKASVRPWDPPTLIVPHGLLDGLRSDGILWGAKSKAYYAFFRLPALKRVRYVALGASIHAALAEVAPRLARRFSPIDLPNLWAGGAAPAPADGSSPVVSFGFFGVTMKGFGTFARIVDDVRARHGNAAFVLVGYVNDGSATNAAVQGLSDAPLSAEEYARRAAGITYSVWTAWSAHYQLTASASFVDSVAFARPMVVLRNAFAEHYFAELGDIGYLCDTMEAVVETISSILAEFPRERYERQRRNLEQARLRFAPAGVAPAVRRIALAALGQGPR